jgi:hypothetical protein
MRQKGLEAALDLPAENRATCEAVDLPAAAGNRWDKLPILFKYATTQVTRAFEAPTEANLRRAQTAQHRLVIAALNLQGEAPWGCFGPQAKAIFDRQAFLGGDNLTAAQMYCVALQKSESVAAQLYEAQQLQQSQRPQGDGVQPNKTADFKSLMQFELSQGTPLGRILDTYSVVPTIRSQRCFSKSTQPAASIGKFARSPAMAGKSQFSELSSPATIL